MPGAGSFQAAAHVYSVAPQDGTILSIGAPTLSLEQKLGSKGIRFDTAQFNWIGRINPLINMIFVRADVPITKIEDALTREVVLAGTGVGSTVSIFPNVMNKLLGYRFKLVMGYKGTNNAMLAVERGEVEGHNTAWEAMKVANPTWLPDKKIRVLVQFGLNRHPDLGDVPTVIELARNDDERRILSAVVSATEIGTSFFSTPNVPADRVEALRRAFDATMADADFQNELRKMRLGLNPMKGEDLQMLSRSLGALPADLTERLKSVYSEN
jgi:tripartite-type tricarboxylate transporter receptor subunit TctC